MITSLTRASSLCAPAALLAAATLLPIASASAQSLTLVPTMETFAGNGTAAYSGDGGKATAAAINKPYTSVFDAKGNLLVADTNNNVIRKIDPDGNITTIAGTGTAGFSGDGGPAVQAELQGVYGVAVDPAGNIYIADTGNQVIRKVDTAGNISTVAGTVPASGKVVSGYTGDGSSATKAKLNGPYAVATDLAGNIYIADTNNLVIRKVDAAGIISTVVGTGSAGPAGDGGPAKAAKLKKPYGVWVDAAGNILVADTQAAQIRKVNTNGVISTLAGNGTTGYSGDGASALAATMNSPRSVTADLSGMLIISDSTNHVIRRVDPDGIITTIAGTGKAGGTGDGGAAYKAQLNFLHHVAIDAWGSYYISDTSTNKIRRMTMGQVFRPVAVGAKSNVQTLTFQAVSDAAITAVTASSGYSVESTTCSAPLHQNDVCSVQVAFSPMSAGPQAGQLTITSNGADFHVALSGSGLAPAASFVPALVQRVAGTAGITGATGDNGAATSATLNMPTQVTTGVDGSTYVADSANHVVRRINGSGTITTVAGTSGVSGYGGDGRSATQALLNNPSGVAVSSDGTLYIADTDNHVIRAVGADGMIRTIAGQAGNLGFAGDAGFARKARLNAPRTLALDAAGVLYIADSGNLRIRRIDTSGIIATFAGSGAQDFGSGDDAAAVLAGFGSISGLVFNDAGELFVSDATNASIRRVDTLGVIHAFAGAGGNGYDGDGGSALQAHFRAPSALQVEPSGSVLVADAGNHVVRRVRVDGTIATLAGTSQQGSAGDEGPSLSASFDAIAGMALLPTGDVLVADAAQSTVRAIRLASGIADFGTQAIHATGPMQTVTLHNRGSAALSLDSIDLTGPFHLEQGGSCTTGASLQSGAACSVNLSFMAVATGATIGTLTFGNTSGGAATTLRGVGVAEGSTIVLTATPLSVNLGSDVVLTATVTGGTSTPTGTVTFFLGGQVLGTALLNAQGIANLHTTALPQGNDVITVSYQGDASYGSSTSSPVTITVRHDLVTPALSLQALPQSVIVGNPVTLTATLSLRQDTHGGLVTGTIAFLDNGTRLGIATIDSTGTASFTFSTLTVGTHTVTASYAGDTNFAPATSTVLSIVIRPIPPDFVLSIGTSSMTGHATEAMANVLTITPLNAFKDSVSFSCAGLPAGATCSFSPATLQPSDTASVSTVVTIDLAPRHAQLMQLPRTGLLAVACLMPLFWVRRRSVRSASVIALLSIAATSALISGCGTTQMSSSGIGIYTVTVNATSATVQHSTTLTLNVR